MDKVLKQRLIGASILIALAVIFVPMLFDGPESDQISRQLDIELPNAPGDRAPIRRLPLDPEQPRVAAQTDSASEADGRSGIIEPSRVRPDVDERDGAQGADDQPRATDNASLDQARSSVRAPVSEQPANPQVEQAQPDPAPQPDESEATPPTLDRPPLPEPTSGAQLAGFEVQVASFGSRENAEGLVDQLTRLGHVASIDIVVRGPSELHRVRTGPYSQRGEALRALNQISQTVSGVRPVIVGSNATVEPATETGTGFAVQVGSFASRDNALRLLDQLGNRGHEAFIHQDRAGSRTIWRVRVGPLGTRDEATQRLGRLTEDEGIDGLVVSHP